MKVVALLVVLFVLTLPALAQDQPSPNPPMNPGMSCPMGGMGQGMMGGGMGMGQGMGQGMGGMHGMQCMCPMCGMMGMGGTLPGQMFIMRAQMLGLTDDQINKIQGIQTDFRRQQIKTGSDIQLAQIDLQQEMMKDSPDMAKVEPTIKRINGLQAELQIAGVKASLASKNVLTPQQRQMCMPMMRNMMMPGMQGGMQPMAPGGQMPMGPMGGMQPMGPPGGAPTSPMAH